MAEISQLSAAGQDLLFHTGRTHNGWQDRAVSDTLLQQVLDLAKMGPSTMNCQPLRVIFIRSPEAKAKLPAVMSPGNLAKTLAAPATALMCYDLEFWRNLPVLFPAYDAAHGFRDNPAAALEVATRNGGLQAGYFIMAARALGLDCGPMSGFNAAKAQEVFVGARPWKVNFMINLGYGDPSALYPRGPRLDFAAMAEII